MLRQDAESMLSVGRTDFHDGVNNWLAEVHIRVVLEAISEEFEKRDGFLRDSVIELAHGLDCFDLELDTKVR